MTTRRITLRPLTPADVHDYRALRQHVLDIGEGRFFADSYTREAALTESQWRDWCTERREHCIIGIFDHAKLIGAMTATQYRAPEDRTAEWEAIWIHPTYRRQGIARRAYQRIELWTRANGYERVALHIRADNLRSQHIHTEQGARYQFTKRNEIWADGSIAFRQPSRVAAACFFLKPAKTASR
jgi:RimJ/RimL family protein N-acetyltransferase